MMLYWHFRNIQCILMGLFKPKIKPSQGLVKTFWANIFDTDYFNSIQAGKFFTYTDAARWEFAGRLGFLKLALKHKLVVIIGGQKIIYRRPVKIFRRFQLRMRIAGWDDKWMYVAHIFEQKGDLKVTSFTKIGFRHGKGLFPPTKAFEEMGHEHIVPPEWIMKHFQGDAETLKLVDQQI